MQEKLSLLIAEIQSSQKGCHGEDFFRVEDLLARVAALRDPDCIIPLLLLMEDDDASDQLMFCIIHLVEMFDDKIYVDRLLTVLPELEKRSPRWAKILHMRIMNSEPAMLSYIHRYRRASMEEKITVGLVLRAIADGEPRFADRVRAVLAANS